MSQKLRLAFIGAGLASTYHRKALCLSRRLVLDSCVAPTNSERNRKFAIQSGIPLFESLEDCISERKIDGVVIASPNSLHYSHALQCISLGLPFLIEKPMTATLDEAQSLFHIWSTNRFKALVGHHRPHNPIIREAIKIVKSGKLGLVKTFLGSAQFYKPDDYFESAIWRKEIGGGPILINMIHEIDIIRRLVGEIMFVSCQTSSSIRGFNVEDSAAINFGFKDGALASFILSDSVVSPLSWEMTSGENPKYPLYSNDCYHICGTEASLSIPSLRLYSYNKDNKSWWSPMNVATTNINGSNSLFNQLEHFADIIEYDVEPLVSIEDGYRNLAVINAINKSAETKSLINVSHDFTSY